MNKIKALKVEWLFTRKCNLSCSYCKIRRSPLYADELDTEEAKDAVSFIGYNWPGAPIVFFGGEPTVRNDLPDVIKHAVESKVKPIVISNSLRVLEDEEYRIRLVESGLKNWSISYDGPDKMIKDTAVRKKSSAGLRAIRMFRDQYGFDDLVACITVNKYNIDSLPKIVEFLSKEGIWSICTPLQLGGHGYDYSSGHETDMPSKVQVERSSRLLRRMANSGNYLMHNRSVWFDAWPDHFISQSWHCHDKSILTLDADGFLRYCVDKQLSSPVSLFDLMSNEGRESYQNVLKQGPLNGCRGCFWDPAFEAILRGLDPEMSEDQGRSSYRHELSEEQIARLLPEARKIWDNHG